uniref:High mobility group AT-hook 1 n=1 Tax=Molossus molossus TaxID=27622 RepID=A0A7J8GPH6_MOLMO|nr:high mobility group AT-hook 1 [Molossus molossus]
MSESSSKSSQPLTSGQTKGEQKQGRCQDPENHHSSREETKRQTQKTGEGGRRGHLAGVLRGGAVTAPPASSPRSSFLLGLDSSAPTAPAPTPGPTSPPPTCARLHRHTTQHTSQALVARVGSNFPLVSVPRSPSPTHMHSLALPDKADFHVATPCTCCGPASAWCGHADWAPGLGAPSPLLPLASH